MLFLSMGLFACVAFSPQPAFAEPDTGPSISEDNKAVFSSSASADLIMPDKWVFEISNTYNYAFEQASGQETGVHRSDHSVVTTHYILKNASLDSKNKLVVNDGDGGPQSWFDHRSRGDTKINGNSENQKFNVISAASMAAMYTGQMVWVLKRPAWPIRPSRL